MRDREVFYKGFVISGMDYYFLKESAFECIMDSLKEQTHGVIFINKVSLVVNQNYCFLYKISVLSLQALMHEFTRF